METVGTRELKARLSHYLKRAQQGERIIVTTREKPIAILGPAAAGQPRAAIEELIAAGQAKWAGGRVRIPRKPAKVRGPSVAEAVIEDRR